MIISGRAGYEFADHDSQTSTGTDDDKSLMAPDATYGTIVSVESAPVRVTFDNERPAEDHGILLPPGVHFLPFAKDIRFLSISGERARISLVWLKGTITNATTAT